MNAARAWPRSPASTKRPAAASSALARSSGPAGLAITFRGREQPGGIVLQQAAAVQRVRLPVRDLRFGGERGGLAREGLRGVQVAGLGRQPDGVGEQVLDLLEFLGTVGERIGQHGQRLRQRAVMLAVQAAGQGQRT